MSDEEFQPEQPSEQIIVALADEYGVDSEDLTPALNEVIDLEALDSLLQTSKETTVTLTCEIRFHHGDYDVCVEHDGITTVTVQPRDEN